jgi:hypothetical protein
MKRNLLNLHSYCVRIINEAVEKPPKLGLFEASC